MTSKFHSQLKLVHFPFWRPHYRLSVAATALYKGNNLCPELDYEEFSVHHYKPPAPNNMYLFEVTDNRLLNSTAKSKI